jgi:transcription elongation factor Elf1
MARRKARKKTSSRSYRFVIPRQFKFPFGYHIKVRRITPTEMIDVFRCKHCGHHDGSDAVGGTWDVDTKTIWLDKTMTRKVQRATFMHEFHHAYKDWELWVRQSGKAAD